ncbi:MAG TPA: antibiotic biosynthesis monooxygenase [Dehalococcoidia bacterium]|nr:antibiotic biosynthesis monooxygenase [Dehalococcoidia bacterium]
MPYVRFSIMNPLPGMESELHAAQKDLLKFFSEQPGFVDGYILTAQDGSGELGRVGIWESESHADQAANSDHVLAVRSRINQLVGAGHRERSFHAE